MKKKIMNNFMNHINNTKPLKKKKHFIVVVVFSVYFGLICFNKN